MQRNRRREGTLCGIEKCNPTPYMALHNKNAKPYVKEKIMANKKILFGPAALLLGAAALFSCVTAGGTPRNAPQQDAEFHVWISSKT
jgi:hypothetical protein